MRRRLVLALLALPGLLVACGDEDEGSSDDSGTTVAAPAAATSPSTAGTSPATSGDSSAPVPSTSAATATSEPTASFPVTVQHKYGETTIEAPPERVVSVGFTDQDALLALGIAPVGIREWYGEHPFATWPWAAPLLGDAEPTVLSASELEIEVIAGLDPDLIVGLSSGMTEEEYALLSQIAPTVAQSGDYIEFGMPWQEATVLLGQAVGRPEEAEGLVADIEADIAAIADEHPEWAGQEAAVAFVLDDSTMGAYASGDPRPALLEALGFVTPSEYDELAGDLFYAQFSFEEMARVDRDLLLWIAGEPAIIEQIEGNPLRDGLSAVQEGREVFLGYIQAGAFSFSSPLSIPYLLDILVPQLEAAADADPATEIPPAE